MTLRSIDHRVPIKCSACGARFDQPAWASLAMIERIQPSEVQLVVRDWPDDLCIEVRSCRKCSMQISMRTRVAPVLLSAAAIDLEPVVLRAAGR